VLSNCNSAFGKQAADAEISMEQINELREGDHVSDSELQKLAQRLVKLNGEAWEERELVDIRLAEDLKRRRQQKRSVLGGYTRRFYVERNSKRA
jgi:hypothetical protein